MSTLCQIAEFCQQYTANTVVQKELFHLWESRLSYLSLCAGWCIYSIKIPSHVMYGDVEMPRLTIQPTLRCGTLVPDWYDKSFLGFYEKN